MGFVEGFAVDATAQAAEVKSKTVQPETWFSVVAAAKQQDVAKYEALKEKFKQNAATTTAEVQKLSDKKKEAMGTADTNDDVLPDKAFATLKSNVIAEVGTFYAWNIVYIKWEKDQLEFFYKRTNAAGGIEYVALGGVDAADQIVFNALMEDLKANAQIDAVALIAAIKTEEEELAKQVAWTAAAEKKEKGMWDHLKEGDISGAFYAVFGGAIVTGTWLLDGWKEQIYSYAANHPDSAIPQIVFKTVARLRDSLPARIPWSEGVAGRASGFLAWAVARGAYVDAGGNRNVAATQMVQAVLYPDNLKEAATEKIPLTVKWFFEGLVQEKTSAADLERITGMQGYAGLIEKHRAYQTGIEKKPEAYFAYMKEGLLALETAAGGASSEFMTANPQVRSAILGIAAYRTNMWKEPEVGAGNVFELEADANRKGPVQEVTENGAKKRYRAYPEGWYLQGMADFYHQMKTRASTNPIKTPQDVILAYYPAETDKPARDAIQKIITENNLSQYDVVEIGHA